MKHTTPILLEEELADLFSRLPKAPVLIRNIFTTGIKWGVAIGIVTSIVVLLKVLVSGTSQLLLEVPFTDSMGNASSLPYPLFDSSHSINLVTISGLLRLFMLLFSAVGGLIFVKDVWQQSRKGWTYLFILYCTTFLISLFINDIYGVVGALVVMYLLFQVRERFT